MSASVNTRKSSVNSEFLRKTAEYLKGGVIEYVSDSMYTVTSTYKESKDTYDEIKSKITAKRESVLPVVRQIKSQMNVRGITNWFLQKESELDDDLPSGTDRQEWDDGTEPSEINEGTPTPSEEERSANKISKTMLESSHKMVEAQISATANVVTTLNEQTAAITAGFDKVDKTLKTILDVVTKNTAAMIEVTTAATAAQMSANEKTVKDGKFSLSNYKDLVKENFNSSEYSAMYSMMSAFMGDPNNFKPDRLVALGVEKLFNKATPNLKKNLEALDQAVSDTIMSSLIRIGERSAKSSNPILGPLGKMFGIDATRKEFDGTRSNLELKTVPFDSVTKEAITGAIPGYLRKILVAVGGDDLVYDYRSRSFRSQAGIRKAYLDTAVKTNNLKKASDSIQSKLGDEDYTKMMYDLMINDLSSKGGSNWNNSKYSEMNAFIAALSDPKNAEKYLTGLLGKGATAADKKNIKILAQRLSTLDQYDLQNGIGLQARQYAVDRNIRTRKYGEEAENYNVDLSKIKDSKWQDANYIMEQYGRTQEDKKRGKGSTINGGSSRANFISGIDYTNRALYEIYRKLNEGINVYQTKDGPYDDHENLLPPPIEYRPKTMKKRPIIPRVSEISGEGGRASNPYADDENALRNNELEDGSTESLNKAQRVGRWGKKRGRQFVGAMISGSGDDVRNVLSASFRDIADIAGDSAKSGMKSINNSFGNVSGYLKHQMFGSGYSYQENTGEVDENGKPIYKTMTVKPNEKAGLFGFFKDEVKMGWDKAKNNTKEWYQEVSGYFDDLKDGDSKSRDINTKRKKLIGTSIGAFAGLGILGGPVGALVGGIAGNAIVASGWADKIHDKLFGRDEETGDATGWLTKAFDKIMDPIEYQFHKTMDFVSNTLKKNVFGPLSDLGFAIKERMLGHVKSIGKRMHEWFEQTWLGQKLKERKERRRKKREARREKRRQFFGKVADKLFGAGAGAAGGFARGAAGVAGGVSYGVLEGSARAVIGTDLEMQKKLTERKRAREERMNLKKTESYDDFVKNSHKRKADRRRRFRNGGYTGEDASEEIASNTADMAETQSEIKSGIDQITGEIIPGSSFKTHDQGIHDRLDKLIELLGGKVDGSNTSSTRPPVSGNQGAELEGFEDEDIIDAENYSIEDVGEGGPGFFSRLGSGIDRGVGKARGGLRWLGRKALGVGRGALRLGAGALGLIPRSIRGLGRLGMRGLRRAGEFWDESKDKLHDVGIAAKQSAINNFNDLRGRAGNYIDNKRAQFQGMKDLVMDDFNVAKGQIRDDWNKFKDEAPDKAKELAGKAKDKVTGMASKASDFAHSALSSVVSMGMSGNSIDDDEKSLMNDIIKEASGDNPNSATISQGLQKMMNLQGKKKEGEQEQEDKKEGFLSKIMGFLGGAGGILANIGKIAAVIGAFYLLFKNDGFKTIAKNIHGMMKTDAEMEAAGTDATTLGMNTATTLVDSQVENKWDWLNPFKSINHNSTDAAGDAIRNSGMTRARNNVFLASGLKKFQTGTTFRQDYYRMKSNKALNKAVQWDEMAGALPEGVLADGAKSMSDRRFAQAGALEAESNSWRSTNTGQLVNAAANIAGIDIMSRGAGGIAQGVASKLGASDEFAQKVGNTTQGITSAGLTVNTISSAARGKTSIVQKVIDAVGKILGKLFEKIGASDKLAKMAGSSFMTGLGEAKDNVLKAVTTGVKNAGDKLVAKLNEKLAEAGLGDVLTVTTGGLMIAAGAVAGAISGFCGTEHLFGVLNGQADAKMKLISTVIEAGMRAAEMVPGVGWVVACFDVIDGLVQSILGCGIKQFIARKLYELISLDGGAALAEKQEAFSAEKDYYNQKYGTNLSDAAFNDMTNNTGLLSRMWSGKAKLGEDGHYEYDEAGKLRKTGGIKNWFVGNDYKYAKDANGNIIQSDDGSAVVAVDKYGNTVKDDRKLGDWVKFGFKNAGRTLFGGDVYATDEEGNVMYDEEGNPIVDHRERSMLGKMLHFQNPFINEQEKDMAKSAVSGIKSKASKLLPWNWGKKDEEEEKAEAEIEGYESEDDDEKSKLKDIIAKGAKFGLKTAMGGGILGLAARTAIKGLKSKLTEDITSVTSAISGYEDEQFITDEEGNPVEYAVDKEGKPLNDDGSKFVKKGDLGSLVISGLLKVTETLTSPIDEMEKGIEEYNKKKSPWAKDGSKDSGSWLSNMVGKVWNGITGAFKSFSNADVSAGGVGGPAEDTHGGGGAGRSGSASAASSALTTAVQTGAQVAGEAVGNKETPEGGNPLNKAYRITSTFGPRTAPHSGDHKGVDLVPSDGSKEADIGSRYKGVVTDVKSDVPDTDTARKNSSGNWEYKGSNATGNMVTIEAEDGKVIKNMHIKAGSIPSNIKPGAKVNVGDKLGQMGSTGWSTGAHLHYQIEEGGSPVDPTSYLTGTTMDEFSSTSTDTIEAAPVDNSSFTTTSTSSTTSDISTSSSSSTSDSSSTESSGSGPLGSLLSALKSAGSKFLAKLTGGLLGSSDDSSSNNGASVSDSSSSTHGGSGASRSGSTSSDQGKYFTTTPNTRWVAVVRKIKELVAAKKPSYNQSGSMTINVDGQDLTVRPDCTGIIAAMLKVYGAIPANKNIYSALLLQDGAINDKFDKMAWPGWDALVEGDIVARNGHAEVFAANDGDTHYVYNGGSTDALCSAGATRTGHKNGYDVIWRCREAGAELADGSTEETVYSDNPLVNAAATAANAGAEAGSEIVRRASGSRNITDKQGLWNYLKSLGYTDYAVAGIMGAWSEETDNRADRLEGDYLKSYPGFDSVLQNHDTRNDWTQTLFDKYANSGLKINRDAYKGTDGNLYPGIGIAQWTGPRGQQLFDFARDRGEDWRDFAPQLDFFKQEYDSKYDSEHILNTKDSPSSAAEFFAKKYENANMPSDMLYKRKAAAEELYKQYADSNNQPMDGDDGMGGPEETSTIGESRYVPSNINTNRSGQNKTSFFNRNESALPSTISSTVSNMTSAINDAMQSLDSNRQQSIETGEIIKALYQIIGLLEVANSNTGQSNSLLSSLSQLRGPGNNGQTPPQRGNNIPKKTNSKPYYGQRNSNNNRMITNMARPN